MDKVKHWLKIKNDELYWFFKRLVCSHGLTAGIVHHRDTFFITVETVIDMSVCEYCGKIRFLVRYHPLKGDRAAKEMRSIS